MEGKGFSTWFDYFAFVLENHVFKVAEPHHPFVTKLYSWCSKSTKLVVVPVATATALSHITPTESNSSSVAFHPDCESPGTLITPTHAHTRNGC